MLRVAAHRDVDQQSLGCFRTEHVLPSLRFHHEGSIGRREVNGLVQRVEVAGDGVDREDTVDIGLGQEQRKLGASENHGLAALVAQGADHLT